jgi:Fe-S-cluster containining protein
MVFNCTKCGACCKRVGLLKHPELPTKRNSLECVHLMPDDTCAIYENRPHVCRVSDNKPEGMTMERWHSMNEAACKVLQTKKEGGS